MVTMRWRVGGERQTEIPKFSGHYIKEELDLKFRIKMEKLWCTCSNFFNSNFNMMISRPEK